MGQPHPSYDKHLRLHDYLGHEDASKVLGEFREELRPSIITAIAGVFWALFAIIGGGALGYFGVRGVLRKAGQMPLWANKEMSWGAVALGGFFVIVLVGSGCAILWMIYSLFTDRVSLYEDGFAKRSGAKLELVRWTEVATIKLSKGHEHYSMPDVPSRIYEVLCGDGRKFVLNVDGQKHVDRVGAVIREVSAVRGIPLQEEEEQG